MINFALKPGDLAWVTDVLGVLHFDEGASFFLGDQPCVVCDGLPCRSKVGFAAQAKTRKNFGLKWKKVAASETRHTYSSHC